YLRGAGTARGSPSGQDHKPGFRDSTKPGAAHDSLFVDPDTAKDAWADVAGSDPSDPWRRTVEEWLDKELPAWRAEAWAAPLT
ncbi:hypothetical protein ACWFQ6_33710, partial [Streptomyces althioticus]